MSDKTGIEWTATINADGSVTPGASWNPVRGCDKVSAGCKNCYAETFAERWRGIKGHPFEQGFDLRLVPKALDKPLRWKKPRKIFVNSMSDLFHEDIPNEYIAAVFGVMAACPLHTFQVLTKRAARMREWFEWLPSHFNGPRRIPEWATPELQERLTAAAEATWPLPNVHLGVSAENQETADERIPLLLQCPAAVRWVSAEPLLGPVDFTRLVLIKPRPPHGPGAYLNALTGHIVGPDDVLDPRLSWIVVGGESGPGARSCDIGWITSIVDQCRGAGVPVFVKQLGAKPTETVETLEDPEIVPLRLTSRKGGDPKEWYPELRVRQFPGSAS